MSFKVRFHALLLRLLLLAFGLSTTIATGGKVSCYGKDKASIPKVDFHRAYASMFDETNANVKVIHSPHQKVPAEIDFPRFKGNDPVYMTLAVYGKVEFSGRYTRTTPHGHNARKETIDSSKQAFVAIMGCCTDNTCHGGEYQYTFEKDEHMTYKAESPTIHLSHPRVSTAKDVSVEHLYKAYNEIFLHIHKSYSELFVGSDGRLDYDFGKAFINDEGILQMESTHQDSTGNDADGILFAFTINKNSDPEVKVGMQFGHMSSAMAQVIAYVCGPSENEIKCGQGGGTFYFVLDPQTGYKFTDSTATNAHKLFTAFRSVTGPPVEILDQRFWQALY